MKKAGIICSVLFCFLFFYSANAQDSSTQNYKAAIGIRFSSKAALINNSVSLKYFFSDKTAAEGLISFGSPFALGLLIEKYKPFAANNLNYFYGGGFYAAFKGSRVAGLQGVVGLDYKVATIPLNFSIDWKPELTFAKEFSFEPQTLGLSARFTLK